jgi:FKBP-type peptidyl-prolyl cis-trans isomerase FkpA
MIKRSSRRTLGVAATVMTLVLVGCGDDPVDPGPNLWGPNPRDVEFAESLEIDLDSMTETSSGLFYRDDVEGTGEAAAMGDAVTVSYTGWLAKANEFDSGVLQITLGETPLIDGFTEGIIGMKLGGTRTIVMPASLGYGTQGSGSKIPGDAVLVFELIVSALFGV